MFNPPCRNFADNSCIIFEGERVSSPTPPRSRAPGHDPELPAHHSVNGQLGGAPDQAGQMMLAKMTFHLSRVGEGGRGLAGFAGIRRDIARLLFPFFHHRRVADDIDLLLIIEEAHPPAEAGLVKGAQLRLIIVMIGRAEQRAAEPAARHVGEIALERFALDDLDRVKVVARTGEGAGFENPAIDATAPFSPN